MYITYKCRSCNKTFILLEEELKHDEEESRYITCPYHGKHKDIIVTGKYDDLNECMKDRAYKRNSGKLKQTRFN